MRKLTSVDLFAAVEGNGTEWAGFECIAFNELNEDAMDSFAANFNASDLTGTLEWLYRPP